MADENSNANRLPYFDYRDRAGRVRKVKNLPRPYPRRIEEYRVRSEKWRGMLPVNQHNANSLLGQDLDMDDSTECIICGEDSANCSQQACVDSFRQTIAMNGLLQTEIRRIPGDESVRKGVFATHPIGKDTRLGEFLGELVPAGRASPDHWLQIALDIDAGEPESVVIEARQFGNWTRFLQPSCEPNVSAVIEMYGVRRAVIIRALRDIGPGEQLTIEYSLEQFQRARKQCRCGAEPGPHLPPEEGVGQPYSSDDASLGSGAQGID